MSERDLTQRAAAGLSVAELATMGLQSAMNRVAEQAPVEKQKRPAAGLSPQEMAQLGSVKAVESILGALDIKT